MYVKDERDKIEIRKRKKYQQDWTSFLCHSLRNYFQNDSLMTDSWIPNKFCI